MALLVLCDPKYRNSAYCEIKIKGIMDESTKRRIQTEIYTDFASFDEAAEKSGADSSVIVLYDSISYLHSAINVILKHDLHIILSANQIDVDLPCTFSMVGSDNDVAMRIMLDYLKMCGKRRIALVAVNRDSANDTTRAKMLTRYLTKEECSIFYIEENTDNCIEEFLQVKSNFDAAICTNDLVAVCLIEKLKNSESEGEKLFVLSHTDTVMARVYGEGITSMTTEFYKCGQALVAMHFNRLRNGFASMRTLIPTEIKVRGSTDNIPYCPTGKLPKPIIIKEIEYQHNKKGIILRSSTGNVNEIERVLSTSDLVDLKLIYCLICNYNYDKMSEFCFISCDTAKYRVRKIRNILKTKLKSEAAEKLRTFIKKESLLSLINEHERINNQIIPTF